MGRMKPLTFSHDRLNQGRMTLKGRILITGGTGSLGTAILERAHKENWPAEFTALARNETKLNQLRQRFPEVRCLIGDIRDSDWLKTIFPGHDTIIHAAAIKIVPHGEVDPLNTMWVNVVGSYNVAQAAIRSDIRRVIGISSDKALGPTMYGTTKRLMEGLFRQARGWGDTDFVVCRYGNVLGSSNSIVPLFRQQIKDNRPFTVTDHRMTRFWLTMRQAIDLILYTLEHAYDGEIYVPVAPACKLVTLAEAMDAARLIEEIGIRPGERLHETLLVREEAMLSVQLDNHFIVEPGDMPVESNLPFQYEYTSDKPEHELTVDEIREMLGET